MVRFDRLEALIKEQGKKKTFLCEKAGKKRGYISDAQNGNGSISDEALAVFARELGTTVEYLTGESGDPGQKKEPVLPEDELKLRLAAYWGGSEDLTEEEIDALWSDAESYYKYKVSQLKRQKGET